MRVLIDIGHPAHFHIFKNLAKEIISSSGEVLFTCRSRKMVKELLDSSPFNYINFGKHYTSIPGKVIGLIKYNVYMARVIGNFKPDVLLSHGSIYAAHAGWLMKTPHICLEDTFNFEQIRLYRPFSRLILTGSYPHPDLGKKEIKHNSFHELAYLHPSRFIPDPDLLRQLNIKKGEKYVILRFVAWNASHDVNHSGMTDNLKRRAVDEFSKYARVFISSESVLPADLRSHEIYTDPENMHDIMAFSSLVFGESATMATEAAVMGVPAIYIDNAGRYYTRYIEERYNLIYNYTESEADQLKAIRRGLEILKYENKTDYKAAGQKLIREHEDLNSFLIRLLEKSEFRNISRHDF